VIDQRTETEVIILTDTEWADILKSSPKEAYGKLVECFGGLVYTIAADKLAGCASKDDIEDCVSDIFVEIFRSSDKYSPDNGNIKTFISTIAKRRAIDAFRQLSRKYSTTEYIDDPDCAPLPNSPDDTENEAEENILRGTLWEAVRSLGKPDSTIIVYQYYYGMTVADIASRLKMTAAAVQKRSLRARDKIKSLIGKGEENG